MTPKSFTFVKNVKGYLAVDLETYDMMGARKTFLFGPNIDRIVVPYPYALGLFVSPEAYGQYQQGIFTIENVDELYKAGVENGFVAREEKPEIATLVDIEDALKNNKVFALKKIIKDHNTPSTMSNIVACAREYFDGLNNEIIDIIQDATGVELRIE